MEWISSVRSPLDYPKRSGKSKISVPEQVSGRAEPKKNIEKNSDSYLKRLLEYIPHNVVALYIAVSGILLASGDVIKSWASWALIGFCICVSPLNVLFGEDKKKKNLKGTKLRAIFAPIAFFSWAFALGGPFVKYSWYNYLYGTILVIFITFLIPLIEEMVYYYSLKHPKDGSAKNEA